MRWSCWSSAQYTLLVMLDDFKRERAYVAAGHLGSRLSSVIRTNVRMQDDLIDTINFASADSKLAEMVVIFQGRPEWSSAAPSERLERTGFQSNPGHLAYASKDKRHLHVTVPASRIVSDIGLSHRTTPFNEIRHPTVSPSMESCEEILESYVLAVELDGLSLRSFSSNNPPWNRFGPFDARSCTNCFFRGLHQRTSPS